MVFIYSVIYLNYSELPSVISSHSLDYLKHPQPEQVQSVILSCGALVWAVTRS